MEPAIYRGDLLFLTLSKSPIEKGEIVVYSLPGKEIPIVHRVLNVHAQSKSKRPTQYLTKGDNNPTDDTGLYWDADRRLNYLERKHIIGRGRAYVPLIGMVTIIMNDYPKLKYLMIGVLCLMVMTSRENN